MQVTTKVTMFDGHEFWQPGTEAVVVCEATKEFPGRLRPRGDNSVEMTYWLQEVEPTVFDNPFTRKEVSA